MASGHQTQRTVDFPIDKESPQQLDQCLSDTTHACSEDVCLEGETSRRSVPVPGNQTKSITADPTTCIVVLNKQLRLLAVPQGPVSLPIYGIISTPAFSPVQPVIIKYPSYCNFNSGKSRLFQPAGCKMYPCIQSTP